MFTSIPNDFFSEENMLNYAEKYRSNNSKSMPGFAYFGDETVKQKNIDEYQNQQAFSMEELRQALPDINQEKQSIELNIHTGIAKISRIKLINGQYMENSREDRANTEILMEDIKKFEERGFNVYRVKNNDQILYLTRYNIL